MIFISHRQADSNGAQTLSNLLKSKNVPCYLDVLDPAYKSNIDITKHIIKTLDKCSHVIVIFSVNTHGSMWVPFELGAAYKGGKGIGTLLIDNVQIPEFLNAFPKMKNNYDLNFYIEEYLSDQKMQKSITNDSAVRLSEAVATQHADSFISRVKSKLHQ
jgi:TIR domain